MSEATFQYEICISGAKADQNDLPATGTCHFSQLAEGKGDSLLG